MPAFELEFSLDLCRGVRLLDHMVTLFLGFWGISTLFPIMIVLIYFPINSVGGFPFLHILSSICRLFSNGQPEQCEVMILTFLIRISLIVTNIDHLFTCVGCRYIFFGEMSVSVFFP